MFSSSGKCFRAPSGCVKMPQRGMRGVESRENASMPKTRSHGKCCEGRAVEVIELNSLESPSSSAHDARRLSSVTMAPARPGIRCKEEKFSLSINFN